MTTLNHIRQLISENRHEEAHQLLDDLLQREPELDEALYIRGKLHWRAGNMRAAMTDLNGALSINPESPARLALGQIEEILNFFNRDLYNP